MNIQTSKDPWTFSSIFIEPRHRSRFREKRLVKKKKEETVAVDRMGDRAEGASIRPRN